MKIEQMRGNNGPVKNQFVIWTDEGCYFQSYNAIIAFRPLNGEPIQLDSNYWNYSKTTGKYRNLFLSETKADTERKIKSGKYILTDLNK
jgi:hypothetical protein